MARSLISEHRLLAKINAKLASDDDCRDYTVSSLMREEKDRTGCNWSVAAMSGSDSFTGTASFRAEKIIKTFRGLYNFPELSGVFWPIADECKHEIRGDKAAATSAKAAVR